LVFVLYDSNGVPKHVGVTPGHWIYLNDTQNKILLFF